MTPATTSMSSLDNNTIVETDKKAKKTIRQVSKNRFVLSNYNLT
jgi:hypothetical protein